jgi:agarase
MRRSGEPDSYTGDWVFTDQIKFYELWAGVSGQRRFARSSDPNLQVATYVDGKTASIVLNNLVPQQKEVSLSAMGLTGLKAEKLVAKHLYLDGDKPRLDSVNLPISQAKFTLQPDATLVLQLTMSDKVPASKTAKETKYYADGYFQPIDTGKSMSFHIDGVQPVARGMAVLRVGLGRDHGRSLRPLVRFNGRKLDVPSGFKGRSQADRKRFFGVLEIPIATSLLKPDNQVSIRFPDATGHLSSLSLVVTGY